MKSFKNRLGVKIVSWILLLPAGLLAIVLAVANRGRVTLSFDPLPFELELPLYVIMLASIFIGIVIGAGVMWWRDGRLRRLARRRGRETAELEREVRILRDRPELPAPDRGAGAGAAG